jgi:hypothetical protein
LTWKRREKAPVAKQIVCSRCGLGSQPVPFHDPESAKMHAKMTPLRAIEGAGGVKRYQHVACPPKALLKKVLR